MTPAVVGDLMLFVAATLFLNGPAATCSGASRAVLRSLSPSVVRTNVVGDAGVGAILTHPTRVFCLLVKKGCICSGGSPSFLLSACLS